MGFTGRKCKAESLLAEPLLATTISRLPHPAHTPGNRLARPVLDQAESAGEECVREMWAWALSCPRMSLSSAAAEILPPAAAPGDLTLPVELQRRAGKIWASSSRAPGLCQ